MNANVPPPPPPPDDPFTTPPPEENGEYEGEGLDTGAPAVAASKGKAMLIMGGLGLLVVYMLYSIFFASEEAAPEVVEEAPRPVVKAEFEPPPLPIEEPPEFVPPPIIQTPAVPQPTGLPILTPEEDNALKEQMQARQRSNMMVVDGGGGGILGGDGDKDEETATSEDPNSEFSASVINNSKAKKSVATHIGDLRRVIAQGRLIQATLETAINTDLPAPIRAIVSRDVYGEAGTVPLIPAGSRLIGNYNTSLSGGQSRVMVVWTRALRPDGVDVQLGSPLVDQIGQAGIGGQVDTKFQYVFSRAVMASVVSIAFAIGSDEVTGGGESSTTNSTFGTTQSGDAASTATVNALNRLGSLSENFLQQFLDIGPTILVDQGTQVNVFVNRDLIFPAELVGAKIIN